MFCVLLYDSVHISLKKKKWMYMFTFSITQKKSEKTHKLLAAMNSREWNEWSRRTFTLFVQNNSVLLDLSDEELVLWVNEKWGGITFH